MFSLENRVAVVTGAASGIGAATAQVFATAGADVVLGWFRGDPHDVQPVRDAVEGTGRRALVVEVDVSSSEQVDALVAPSVEKLGRRDIAVGNAGIAREVAHAELGEEAGYVSGQLIVADGARSLAGLD